MPRYGYAAEARRVHRYRETQLASLWSSLLREVREHLEVAQYAAAPYSTAPVAAAPYHLATAARLLETMAGVVENRRAELRSRRGGRTEFNRVCAYADQLAHALKQIGVAQAAADWRRYGSSIYSDIQDVKRELPEMGQTSQIAPILGYDPCLAAWLQG